MPEAKKCSYVELEEARIRVETDADAIDWIDKPCDLLADHLMIVKVEGFDPVTDHLCCKHRAQTLSAALRGKTAVEIVADQIIDPSFSYECYQEQGGWACRVTAITVNGYHQMPASMLHATTASEAWAEAAVLVNRLKKIAQGIDPDVEDQS